MKEKHWVIKVSCWGTIYAVGTEVQAEEWRAHKADWEGCPAHKRLATDEEISTHNFDKLADFLN